MDASGVRSQNLNEVNVQNHILAHQTPGTMPTNAITVKLCVGAVVVDADGRACKFWFCLSVAFSVSVRIPRNPNGAALD